MNKKVHLKSKFRGNHAPARQLYWLVLLVVLAACLLAPQASNGQADRNSTLQSGPSPTPTSLLEPALAPTPEDPAEAPRLPLGVSSLIGASLLALAYWLNKRSGSKNRDA